MNLALKGFIVQREQCASASITCEHSASVMLALQSCCQVSIDIPVIYPECYQQSVHFDDDEYIYICINSYILFNCSVLNLNSLPISSRSSVSFSTVSRAMAVDTSGPDRGLNSIFSHVRMDDDLHPLRNLLTHPRGITRWSTTEDFYHCINPDAIEPHLEKILDNFEDYREGSRGELNHLRERAIGKLRQAYRLAQRLTTSMEELAPDQDVDFETPLAPGVMQNLTTLWSARYHFKVRTEFDPCNENIAQYHRMCKAPQSFRFVTLEKHKAIDGEKIVPSDSLPGIQAQYSQMRIMANALAKAGNFKMTCSILGPDTIMAPWDINMNYADDAFYKGLAMRDSGAQWLRDRDKTTRTIMVSKIRDGMSQGEALRQAISECTFEWKDAKMKGKPGTPTRVIQRDRTPIQRKGKQARKKDKGRKRARSDSSSSSRSPPPSAKKREKQAKAKSSSKKKEGAKEKIAKKYTEKGKNGKSLCVNWNMQKGCQKGDDCKFVHNECNRKLKKGGHCGRDHPAYKCDHPDRIK